MTRMSEQLGTAVFETSSPMTSLGLTPFSSGQQSDSKIIKRHAPLATAGISILLIVLPLTSGKDPWADNWRRNGSLTTAVALTPPATAPHLAVRSPADRNQGSTRRRGKT
jgi:hypothetical protein